VPCGLVDGIGEMQLDPTMMHALEVILQVLTFLVLVLKVIIDYFRGQVGK